MKNYETRISPVPTDQDPFDYRVSEQYTRLVICAMIDQDAPVENFLFWGQVPVDDHDAVREAWEDAQATRKANPSVMFMPTSD